MHEHFEVGEVAIVWIPGHQNHGREVTILSALQRSHQDDAVLRHQVSTENLHLAWQQFGIPVWAAPDQLRKKPKNRDDHELVEWKDVPYFDPTRVKA